MNLTREQYTVSRETLALVLEALNAHWFSDVRQEDGYIESYNNDDVIAADERLRAELKAQGADPT